MKLLTSPTWEAEPLPVTEGLWDDVIPGNPLEVTSAQSEVSPRCGAKVSSPSRPPGGLSQLAGARAPQSGPDKGAEVLGGEEKA